MKTENNDEFRELLKRSLAKVSDLKAKIGALEASRREPIAIVGLGCRFPGDAHDPDSYWNNLISGVDAIREIGADRWPGATPQGKSPPVRWAGQLERVDAFDPGFFEISPREAASLDPQQRLLLEVSWEALESAGVVPQTLDGSETGVFVGLCFLDYLKKLDVIDDQSLDAYCFTGNLMSTAAGRISYVLGLRGPCMTVDTACSSSLVAIHLACQSLRLRECNLALAGGANLILSPQTMAALARTQALSPDGRCKSFDAAANGFVRGEGCGVVVLKRLSDAVRDGDRIWALIRGSAVNQDGRSAGLTAPSVLAQQQLLRQALENAQVAAEEIEYVETHGTGTSLGDPIEFEALKEVLGAPRANGSSCVLGAVKTNMGHLEAAAGVAGLIKAVLCLRHGAIPRNLHFRTLNPRISLEGTPFVVPTRNLSWERGQRPRRAGVSSFGISGTNAHVILEQPPEVAQQEKGGVAASQSLLVLSAKNDAALRELAERYAVYLRKHPEHLANLSYTASTGRSHFEERVAVVALTAQEAAEKLESVSRGELPNSSARGTASRAEDHKVAFLFTGQGSQYVGMGRGLFEHNRVFRETLLRCQQRLPAELLHA